MPERAPVDVSIVGIDTDFTGTDACCITSLSGQEPTPNGIALICDVCGDAWVSQTKDDGSVFWMRTFAGRYSNEVRAKISEAAKNEHKTKVKIGISISAVVIVVILWNIADYVDEPHALGRILFSSVAVIVIAAAASFALFGSLFRRFSRNSKKLKYEIKPSV